MQPSDVMAFHFKAPLGARCNTSDSRCRACYVRFIGDDARFVTRSGKTSAPFPGHNMQHRERLREDWYPVVHP